MSAQENKRVVQSVFEAFGRGDIPGVLSVLADDVLWTMPGPPEVPYYGERRGHEGVTDFFVRLGTHVEFESFEPREFIAEGERVVVLGFERGRVRSTGKIFDNDWALVFTVRDGKVSHFRSYENTGAVADAFN
jgi:ketosteroid isomerase-like protein